MSPPPSTSFAAHAAVIPAEHAIDRRAAFSLVWQGARVLLQTAQYVLLARLIVPEEFGKYALVAPLYALFGVLHDGGLSTAAVTGRRYDGALASMLCWAQLGAGAVLALGMVLLSPVLALWFGVPDLGMVGAWLGACLLVGSCGLQSRAALRREVRLGALALVELGGAAAGLVSAWVIAGYNTGVEILLGSMMFSVGVSAAIAVSLAPVALHRPRMTADFHDAMRTGRDIVGAEVMNILRVQMPAFVAGFFVMLADVGLFNRANQLLNLPLAVLAPALTNFLLPVLSRVRDDAAEFRRHVRRTQRLFLAVAVPASVWIAAGPTDLIAFVLGPEWMPVVPILRNLSPLFISQVIATIAGVTLVGTEESRAMRWFSFWNLLLTAVAVLLAAPSGVEAMALAIAVSGIALRAPLLVGLAVHRGSLAMGDVWSGLRRLAILAVAAGTVLGVVEMSPLAGAVRDVAGLLVCLGVSAAALARDLCRTKGRETS